MPLLAEKVIPSLAQMVAAGLDDKFGSGLLLMVRFKNQTGTVKDTQFEVKETKDKPTGTVGPWSMR